MPVYQIGDLVKYRITAEGCTWDDIGFILEMGQMGPLPGARILWGRKQFSDWCFLQDLEVMQTEQPVVE